MKRYHLTVDEMAGRLDGVTPADMRDLSRLILRVAGDAPGLHAGRYACPSKTFTVLLEVWEDDRC